LLTCLLLLALPAFIGLVLHLLAALTLLPLLVLIAILLVHRSSRVDDGSRPTPRQ
jgi:hypothetical protein